MNERAGAPFNVFAGAQQSLPCGCRVHRGIDGHAVGWDPCEDCGPFIARVVAWCGVAGLVHTTDAGALDGLLTARARPGGRWIDGRKGKR